MHLQSWALENESHRFSNSKRAKIVLALRVNAERKGLIQSGVSCSAQ